MCLCAYLVFWWYCTFIILINNNVLSNCMNWPFLPRTARSRKEEGTTARLMAPAARLTLGASGTNPAPRPGVGGLLFSNFTFVGRHTHTRQLTILTLEKRLFSHRTYFSIPLNLLGGYWLNSSIHASPRRLQHILDPYNNKIMKNRGKKSIFKLKFECPSRGT